MEAFVEVDLVIVNSSQSQSPSAAAISGGGQEEIETALKNIFFDGIQYPEVDVRFRDSREGDLTDVVARIEIMNLAGDEDLEDIRAHFDQQMAAAIQSGAICRWKITKVGVDGHNTRVDWSSSSEDAALQPKA